MSLAKDYLLFKRNLTDATINEWQLGYCNDWRVISGDVTAQGRFSIAEKLGLVKHAKDDEVRIYDFFHHRITIPIHDALGRLVGFGGRLLPNQEGPKYLNPQASPVYDKSRTLFGLHKARRHFKDHGCACLVEGYFDVIRLHEKSWNNTIGTGGTALTSQQAKLIRRYTRDITDNVLLMRDGDTAGRRAIEKDIPILTAVGLVTQVLLLPEGEDPDSFFDKCWSAEWWKWISTYDNYFEDGVEWLASRHIIEGYQSTAAMASAIDKVVELLSLVENQVRREQYIKSIARSHKLRASDISKPLDRYFKDKLKEAEAQIDVTGPDLPVWFNQDKYYHDGFVQNPQHTKTHRAGIYAMGEKGPIRLTNFTIEPLYQIIEFSNPRRLVRVNNGSMEAVVEMPNAAFVTKNIFHQELLHKGNFNLEYSFQPRNFMQLVSWINERLPMAYELKTLGWQPEGFFAFANAVIHNGELHQYDDLGMVTVEGKNFLSLGNSKIHANERITDNPYENDLYLKYVVSPVPFSKWAELFVTCYDANGPYGIAFVLLTIFKDLVTRVAKMPMLYCFGPKGSGKSAMAESITYLFFSGKNPEGDLIKGYNLNPGQGTPFSFFNRVARFRNCPVLMNEFDEDLIEPTKFGAFKAAYDGEGREVGSIDAGKKARTSIQKVQGTIVLVGQYLSVKDDGSVLSRSISCQFSLERISGMSQEQVNTFKELETLQDQGLSSILVELMGYRPAVHRCLSKNFGEIQARMMNETRTEGHRIEARLISNYCLMLAMVKTVGDAGLKLPFTYESFYVMCKKKIVDHNRVLKDNNALQQFWKGIESLFDAGLIKQGDMKIRSEYSITLKIEGANEKRKFPGGRRVLYLRFANVYNVYAESYRKRTGKSAQAEATYLVYLKEQSYYFGLCPAVDYDDNKRTSGQAFDYDALVSMGIVLDRDTRSADLVKQDQQMTIESASTPPTVQDDETPF